LAETRQHSLDYLLFLRTRQSAGNTGIEYLKYRVTILSSAYNRRFAAAISSSNDTDPAILYIGLSISELLQYFQANLPRHIS
jgi:hypothetical protein